VCCCGSYSRPFSGSDSERYSPFGLCRVAVTFAPARAGLAATCGEPAAGASTPTKATLQLDAARSDLQAAFGKSTDGDDLSMFFKVSGCDLPEHPANPTLTPIALKDSKNIHQDTLEVLSTRVTGDDELAVSITVRPKTFRPGTYTSLVLVEADYMKTASVTVQVSRSEPRWWLIGMIGIGIGVGAFC
jgi:hypothetical protein